MSEGDPLSLLSESAARVHGLAREGLGLPALDVLSLRQPWRAVAAHFLELADGNYAADSLAATAAFRFAVQAGLGLDHAVLAEAALPAWQAVARHLAQWVNELAEGSLRGMEASEESWKEWAKQRSGRVLVEGN